MSSEVVIDVYGFTRDGSTIAQGEESTVALEPWQVRELLGVISSYRLKANTTSHGYLDDLHDALESAL